MTDENATITCDCDRRLEFERSGTRLECDCGARYVVTVTQLVPPGGRSRPPTGDHRA